jgi:hypothetical protein
LAYNFKVILEPADFKPHNPTRGRKFQATFGTPLKRLDRFVETLFGEPHDLRGGWIYFESVIFEPRNLNKLLTAKGIPLLNLNERALRAESGEEAHKLLKAALGDWVDFFFGLDPGRIAIYADHDEFTTVYASRKDRLDRIIKGMEAIGIKEEDYVRPKVEISRKGRSR